MTGLHHIRETVRQRAEEMTAIDGAWPCHKGCDECCRHLAAEPRVTRAEWESISAALANLPGGTARGVFARIRKSSAAFRPVVCPLLDADSGTCLVYEARPVACRAYGFYAERQFVLGCGRIEALGLRSPDLVWGNHRSLEASLGALGEAATLTEWLVGR